MTCNYYCGHNLIMYIAATILAILRFPSTQSHDVLHVFDFFLQHTQSTLSVFVLGDTQVDSGVVVHIYLFIYQIINDSSECLLRVATVTVELNSGKVAVQSATVLYFKASRSSFNIVGFLFIPRIALYTSYWRRINNGVPETRLQLPNPVYPC